jgi:hypothetical protein
MVEPVKREGLCSFCDKPAVTSRADNCDIFDACAECAAAWDKNPGFLSAEEQDELVERINANPYLRPIEP